MNELAIRDEAGYFATVAEIRTLVDRIEHVSEAKDLADRARAAQVWAERQRLGQEKVNLAIVARFWAARREGELLSEIVVARGNHDPGARGSSKSLPEGIDKAESKRTQDLAAIPPDDYAEAIDDCVTAGRVNFAELHRRVERRERERQAAEEEGQLLAEVQATGGPTFRLEQNDLRKFDPGPVDAIVTDPPYITDDAPELYAELARFAARTLRPGGVVAAMTWQPLLPGVFGAFAAVPELRYRWTVAWVSGSHETTVDHNRRIQDRWKPVIVFHRGDWPAKAPMLADVVFTARDQSKDEHPWQQDLGGFRQLVRGLSEPGEIVCDPFLGAGTTAVAALAESRHFVGCDIDAKAVAITNERLAA